MHASTVMHKPSVLHPSTLLVRASLPKGHLVRNTLAEAAVKGYFHFHDNRFVDKAEEYPDFSVDILTAMKATFKSLTSCKRSVTFKDPLSGDSFDLDQSIRSG